MLSDYNVIYLAIRHYEPSLMFVSRALAYSSGAVILFLLYDNDLRLIIDIRSPENILCSPFN